MMRYLLDSLEREYVQAMPSGVSGVDQRHKWSGICTLLAFDITKIDRWRDIVV